MTDSTKVTTFSIAKWTVVVLISFCSIGVILSNLEIIQLSPRTQEEFPSIAVVPVATIIPNIGLDPNMVNNKKINTPNVYYEEPDDRPPVTQNSPAKPCPIDPKFALLHNLPKPDFCMIGVAKGGSTSFSNYLRAFFVSLVLY
mmetsp:Transcript_22414/g.28634  ORF Transcript_22414/g.28634 Transcript_22414/m.28634 type:complete len:143 (-) Transcript_22414:848-1276(-)